jgi:hypothetical protein
VQARLESWSDQKEVLWQGVLSRCGKSKPPSVVNSRHQFEKRVIGALRVGDVRKALQLFVAAPIAPKTEETLLSLKQLHPVSPPQELPSPTHDAPVFTDQHVRQALFSFAPTSAAGLFGYRPSLMQQCARAESFHFVPTLKSAVNLLAAGKAGGVSIALAKPNRGVRPLCCGDPLRRLVAKCFCLGGKGEIARGFERKNYGVGCPGGVEAVAHSLRDVLQKHRKSDLALLKIDFKNAFNLLSRDAFVRATAKMFPGLERWTWWCYNRPLAGYDHSKQ